MELIRDIHLDKQKQFVIDEVIGICSTLNTQVLAEGVESKAELDYLVGRGINYFQGYYFAKPQLEYLTTFDALDCYAAL